jgi:hypothetical protein
MTKRGRDSRADLRASTAERSEVTDMLSQHYAEGRLDAAEFNERIELAATAKTKGDLTTLLTDLPGSWTGAPTTARRSRRPGLRSAVLLGFLALAVVWATAIPHVAWLLVAAVAYMMWRGLHFHGRVGCAGGTQEIGSGS